MRTQSYYYLRNLIIDKFKSKNVFLGKNCTRACFTENIGTEGP